MQLPLIFSIFGRILERQVGVCWMIFQQVWAPGAHLECSWWDWQLPAAPVECGIAPHEPWKQTQIPQGSRVLVFPLLPAILTLLGTETNPCPTWQSKINREFR